MPRVSLIFMAKQMSGSSMVKADFMFVMVARILSEEQAVQLGTVTVFSFWLLQRDGFAIHSVMIALRG